MTSRLRRQHSQLRFLLQRKKQQLQKCKSSLLKSSHDCIICILQTRGTHLYDWTSQTSRSQVDTCNPSFKWVICCSEGCWFGPQLLRLIAPTNMYILMLASIFERLFQISAARGGGGAWSHCEGHWRRGGGVDASSSLSPQGSASEERMLLVIHDFTSTACVTQKLLRWKTHIMVTMAARGDWFLAVSNKSILKPLLLP